MPSFSFHDRFLILDHKEAYHIGAFTQEYIGRIAPLEEKNPQVEKVKTSAFYSVWRRMREDFLKREHPAIYRHLMKSGERMSYLDGYQQAYSKRAAVLDAELSKERGLTDDLMGCDPLR